MLKNFETHSCSSYGSTKTPSWERKPTQATPAYSSYVSQTKSVASVAGERNPLICGSILSSVANILMAAGYQRQTFPTVIYYFSPRTLLQTLNFSCFFNEDFTETASASSASHRANFSNVEMFNNQDIYSSRRYSSTRSSSITRSEK